MSAAKAESKTKVVTRVVIIKLSHVKYSTLLWDPGGGSGRFSSDIWHLHDATSIIKTCCAAIPTRNPGQVPAGRSSCLAGKGTWVTLARDVIDQQY